MLIMCTLDIHNFCSSIRDDQSATNKTGFSEVGGI